MDMSCFFRPVSYTHLDVYKRQDRLNVISVQTPPLRDRKDDIFELAVHFLGQHARRVGKTVTHLDDETVEALVAHDWPGNIRELENVIERAVVLAEGPAVTRADLPPEVRQPARRKLRATVRSTTTTAATTSRPKPQAGSTWSEPTSNASEEGWDAEYVAFERQRLVDALDEARGNKSEAARLLGMPRSTLCSKLKKHGLL